jgi:hypothetical protein
MKRIRKAPAKKNPRAAVLTLGDLIVAAYETLGSTPDVIRLLRSRHLATRVSCQLRLT